MAGPSDAATLERAHSFADEYVRTVALQRRRLRSTEPEDEDFLFRWWADVQFLLVALRQLLRAARLAATVLTYSQPLNQAIDDYLAAVPALRRMRDVETHFDEYALDQGKRWRDVGRRSLQVGSWDGTTFQWLGVSLDVDEAMAAADALYGAVRDALHDAAGK